MVIWNVEKRRWGFNIPTFLTKEETSILKYAITAYGFVMKNKPSYSFIELADEIEKVYDLNNPRNWEVARVLRRAGLKSE